MRECVLFGGLRGVGYMCDANALCVEKCWRSKAQHSLGC